MGFEQIIGSSPVLKHAFEFANTVASSDSIVLPLGETGSGNELIVRAIHDRSRPQRSHFCKTELCRNPYSAFGKRIVWT